MVYIFLFSGLPKAFIFPLFFWIMGMSVFNDCCPKKKKWSSDLVSAQKYNINFPLFGPDDVISYSIKPL